MKKSEKLAYLDLYDRERQRGEPYFSRYALRDAGAAIVLLVMLMLISAGAGAPLDERADPLSTDYVPRPEWYFLFIFQLLKYFSGDAEVIGIVVIPIGGVLFLALLPFLDRSRRRHFRRRPIVTGATAVLMAGFLVLTAIAIVEAPPPADASELTFGGPEIDGAPLYATYCAGCHGTAGEGGPNPAEPGDVIPPISTAEYLAGRTDESLRAVVAEGLPDFGMAAFERAHGGPLRAAEVDAIVAHMRAWEDEPPVQFDAAVSAAGLSNSGDFLYPELCAGCHGAAGEGGLGTALADAEYQEGHSDQEIFNSINLGHQATAMIAWGEVLTKTQVDSLVAYIRGFGVGPEVPRYNIDVLPIFEVRCLSCHGTAGGWDGASRETAVASGDHAPVVVPGDPAGSVLVQMVQGTHPEGILMPPDGKLPEALVQLVIDWVEGGALE